MSHILEKLRWSVAPPDVEPLQRKNFLFVQIDGVGIGLASAASPFLPVFLTRLGASNFQVALLTAMPAATGLILAILVGNFLQSRRNVIPWFSAARLMVVSAYAATGLAPFLVSQDKLIVTILLIWAAATLPQTAVAVAFSVVMNAVAGPAYRYDLMSRRWSILGLTMALTTAIAGQVLDHVGFTLNYQIVFLGLSVGGLISFIFSSRLKIPDMVPHPAPPGRSMIQRSKDYLALVRSHPDFVTFSLKRFVFLSGQTLASPIFPLYYVRVVNANDASIGFINTAQTAVLLLGYALWTRQNRIRGSRFVLLINTLGLSLYPILVSKTSNVPLIIIISGLAGIFQAGIDLVFFDELMKTVPVEYSATFVSIAQSLQYTSSILAPIIGTFLANKIGLGGALMVSGAIRLAGFMLFTLWVPEKVKLAAAEKPELVA
jgi:MFS family permease